ncbi:MAG: alginate export family protein [Candidatus Omnitrophica bacterium]|jgi:hypothetical protein|nr:alginate export family protein [Candidatus Omnitrophota bacterium]
MSKRLIVILTLLFVVGIAFAAYAEVQNVKVSGDILVSGLSRNHFGLIAPTGDKGQLKQNLFMTQTRVRIDADLTDNVMATVRLINERVWNGQNDTSSDGNSKIDLDLAYVTLKEFLYSPLSFVVGRQEIRFGNGLIIGNAKVANGVTNIPSDLTERKAFDAVRATLNYDPLVIDFIYAKIKQETLSTAVSGTGTTLISDKNDIALAGINATYAITKNTNLSAYYYNKRDNNAPAGRNKSDQVNTIGALISSTPIENLTASVEGAYQFGRNSTNSQDQHKAWAFQAMLDYTFAKIKTTPKIGASWTYLSGSKTGNTQNAGWDPMFYDQKLNGITYAILPFTNMSVINLKGSFKPMDDVTVSAVYGYYDVAEKNNAGAALISPFTADGTNSYLNTTYTGKRHLGDALDLTVTYDYTEDVQLALTGGWFKPGQAISVKEKDATQLIGSMKVAF